MTNAPGKGWCAMCMCVPARSGAALCCVLVNGKTLPREQELTAALRCAEPGLTGVVLGVNETHSNVILGTDYRTLWGEDFLYDTLCGFTFKLSVPSFYQVNPDQAEVLYDRVLELADLTGEQTVLDLYCGIGPSAWSWPAGPSWSMAPRWCARPLRTRWKTPGATGWETPAFCAPMRERPPCAWRRRACVRM